MRFIPARRAFAAQLLLICFLFPHLSMAQSAATLSGTVKDASGKDIANAKVSAVNSAAGSTVSTSTGPDGTYRLAIVAPGAYTVTVTAEGSSPGTSSVTISAGASQVLDLTLTPLPNAPAAVPSLGDLGFSTQQMQSNPQLQATLQRRTQMLKIHQRLGLITAIPMAAALITGPMAKAKGRNGQVITEPSSTNLDLHAALGGATTVLYFATAYYAIRAPRIPGTQKHGAIRWHEALAWVHGTGMILTPVFGVMAYKQENDGEKVHGIASAHGTVAWVTAAAYGTAIVAVSWPIHLKFWEK
jgi:hypothetical protein